jgi:hypothetical protein
MGFKLYLTVYFKTQKGLIIGSYKNEAGTTRGSCGTLVGEAGTAPNLSVRRCSEQKALQSKISNYRWQRFHSQATDATDKASQGNLSQCCADGNRWD